MKKVDWVKALAIVILLISLITLCVWDHYDFGWSQGGEWHSSLKVQRKKAEFVRSHSCTVTQVEPTEEFDSDFNMRRQSGFKSYSCIGFRGWIFIHDYEVQP